MKIHSFLREVSFECAKINIRCVNMNFRSGSILIRLACLIRVLSVSNSSPLREANDSFELSIIHFSDFHSRYVPVAPSGGLCYEKEKCIGGIARVARVVKRLKRIRRNAIFLNAGDCFQGTLYYDVYRGNISAYFMNKLPHDAITIGNHDFDDGISGLASYIKELKAPVVVTNFNRSKEPSLQNLYSNSTVIEKGEKKIGIIGVIFSDTDKISTHTENMKFLNEVETINLEAQKLKSKGVEIIVVLSHCGIEHDKIIAKNCPEVDVIVGGHSHILLYNGKAPSDDIVYDRYPIVIHQRETKRKVLIVHASAFTKYIGDIRIIFDQNNDVAYWRGNPIYLSDEIQQEQSIVKDLQAWSVKVEKIAKRFIGRSRLFLNATCFSGECNMANLITDAYVDKYSGNATIAMMSAISIQNSIPEGDILYEDLYMTLPYNNTWDLIELRGKDLLQILENNVVVNLANSNFANPMLLQWSGLRVVYNLSNPLSKVVSAKARCLESSERFQDIELNKWYRIVVDSYLVTDAFKIINEKHRNHVSGHTYDIDNLCNYVGKIKNVDVDIEGRMLFV